MSGTIKMSGFDLCRAYTEANTGTTYAAPTMTLETGTADSAYPVANLTSWNLANSFRATMVAGAGTVRINMASSLSGSYNAVFVVEPYIPQFSPPGGTATGFTSLALYSGSAAGTITTLEDTITAANLADGGFLKVGQSRVWTLKISSASSLATSGAGKFLELRWTGTGTASFGAGKIGIYSMYSPFSDLSMPIADSVQYGFIDRSFISELESGGQSRYSRDYVRSVVLPIQSGGDIGASIVGMTNALFLDAEPYMIAMDWESNLVAGGEHIHTFPFRQNNGVQMSIRSQFSRSQFMMADFAYNIREYR